MFIKNQFQTRRRSQESAWPLFWKIWKSRGIKKWSGKM